MLYGCKTPGQYEAANGQTAIEVRLGSIPVQPASRYTFRKTMAGEIVETQRMRGKDGEIK